jgi:hypothetical protein
MNIHPSQRRFACEVCKKDKAKCQRLHHTDLKCSRCTMLGVSCDPGRQKKVGRPRRSECVSVHKVLKSTGNSSDKNFREANKPYRQQPFGKQRIISPSGSLVKPSPKPLASQAETLTDELSFIRRPTQLTPLTRPASWNVSSWTPNEPLHIDANYGTSTADRYVTSIMSPLYSSPDDTSDCESEWPDIATIPTTIQTRSLPWLSPPGDETRYSSSKATGAMYFDTRLRTVVNEPAPLHCAATNHSELPDIVDALSSIRHGIELRCTIIRRHKSALSLDTLIYRHSPLFIDNYTLSEFLISASQDFLQVLSRLQASRKWKVSTSIRTTAASLEHLPHALAYMVSSIFLQLISFYELFLEHLTSRIEHISTHPVVPIPGFTLNGKPLTRPCDQGLMFCDIVLGLLERLENVLGFEAEAEGQGLLSTEQVDDLWSQMDGSNGLASGYGIMRPADVKALFRKMAAVFERLSLTL